MIAEALGIVAPMYNLVLVTVVVIMLIKLFTLPNTDIYLPPWELLFIALLFYIVEEALTVYAIVKNTVIPPLVAPILEMIVISIFIYMLLLQKNYIKTLVKK